MFVAYDEFQFLLCVKSLRVCIPIQTKYVDSDTIDTSCCFVCYLSAPFGIMWT